MERVSLLASTMHAKQPELIKVFNFLRPIYGVHTCTYSTICIHILIYKFDTFSPLLVKNKGVVFETLSK